MNVYLKFLDIKTYNKIQIHLKLTLIPYTVNPRLEVDLYYKSTPLEVGLFRHVLPLHIMKILLLGRF